MGLVKEFKDVEASQKERREEGESLPLSGFPRLLWADCFAAALLDSTAVLMLSSFCLCAVFSSGNLKPTCWSSSRGITCSSRDGSNWEPLLF